MTLWKVLAITGASTVVAGVIVFAIGVTNNDMERYSSERTEKLANTQMLGTEIARDYPIVKETLADNNLPVPDSPELYCQGLDLPEGQFCSNVALRLQETSDMADLEKKLAEESQYNLRQIGGGLGLAVVGFGLMGWGLNRKFNEYVPEHETRTSAEN